MENATNRYSYRVELANKVVRGNAVGNLWGVAKLINGCRNTWVLEPQESEQKARDLAEVANTIERGRTGMCHAEEGALMCGAKQKGVSLV